MSYPCTMQERPLSSGLEARPASLRAVPTGMPGRDGGGSCRCCGGAPCCRGGCLSCGGGCSGSWQRPARAYGLMSSSIADWGQKGQREAPNSVPRLTPTRSAALSRLPPGWIGPAEGPSLECEDTALGSSRLPTYRGRMLLLTPQGSGAHVTGHTRPQLLYFEFPLDTHRDRPPLRARKIKKPCQRVNVIQDDYHEPATEHSL